MLMMKVFLKLILAVVFLAVSAGARAGLQEGIDAYEKGDYQTALKQFKPLQGDKRAQFFMGVMYEQGLGVPHDDKAAAGWYSKAAEQGDVEAQYNLGRMYDLGQGVPQNDKLAAEWYRKAAELGDAEAQYSLGVMYWQAEVFRLISSWEPIGIARPPSREMQMRRPALGCCMTWGKVFRRTTSWR